MITHVIIRPIDLAGEPRKLNIDEFGNLCFSIADSSGNSLDLVQNVHSSDYELPVTLTGHVCSHNTTVTPLGANQTFIGQWQDCINYGLISIGVNADQNSATNGLVIQWSIDGSIIHDTDTFSILANKSKTFTFGPARRFIRVIYTNGTISQGSFNIETSLRRVYVKPSSHRIYDSIVGDDDAELVKSVLTGLRDDATFGNVGLDNQNNLRVNSFPYTYSIAEGAISGHSSLLKFGTRTSVLANTQSVVWEGANALYTYLTTAQQLKIASSSAQDAPGGTGALTLTLVGLDANWLEISETITMTGASVVTTTASFIRIFRAYVASCGSSLANVGAITVTNNAGTVVQLIIPATDGQTLMTMWTVPAGKVAYLTGSTVSTDSNKGARVSIYTRLNDGGTTYPWLIKYRAFLFGGNNTFSFNIPFKIPAKTDIEVRVTTPASAGTTSAGSTFELWYENL